MTSSTRLALWTLVTLFVPLQASSHARAGEPSSAGGSGVEVMNNKGELRAFLVFKTPIVISKEGKLRPALSPVWNKRKTKGPQPLPDFQSPLPPKNWRAADFDDSAWDRQLAAKVEKFLAVRGETFINYWHKHGWNYINKWSIAGQFDSDAQLLELAAEVAEATK